LPEVCPYTETSRADAIVIIFPTRQVYTAAQTGLNNFGQKNGVTGKSGNRWGRRIRPRRRVPANRRQPAHDSDRLIPSGCAVGRVFIYRRRTHGRQEPVGRPIWCCRSPPGKTVWASEVPTARCVLICQFETPVPQFVSRLTVMRTRYRRRPIRIWIIASAAIC
jgi:hypothetical protein